MADHRKLSNAAFLEVLNNLIKKSDGNEADYGFTAAKITLGKAIRDTLQTDENDKVAKRAASKAATTKAANSRKIGDDFFADLKITAKSEKISADKLNDIGIDADDEIPSTNAPQTPTDLTVTGTSNGTNTVKFKRSGNIPTTLFDIEAIIGTAADYVLLTSITKTVFKHKNQKPGIKILYRVRARRGDLTSDYSNAAVVYE